MKINRKQKKTLRTNHNWSRLALSIVSVPERFCYALSKRFIKFPKNVSIAIVHLNHYYKLKQGKTKRISSLMNNHHRQSNDNSICFFYILKNPNHCCLYFAYARPNWFVLHFVCVFMFVSCRIQFVCNVIMCLALNHRSSIIDWLSMYLKWVFPHYECKCVFLFSIYLNGYNSRVYSVIVCCFVACICLSCMNIECMCAPNLIGKSVCVCFCFKLNLNV